MQLGPAVGVGNCGVVERAAGDLELLLRLVDLGRAARSRGRPWRSPRGCWPVSCHRRASRSGRRRRAPRRRASAMISTSLRGPSCRARAAVAQADVVEHRLLRRRLRLFVAGQHRQDDRLLGQAVGVAGVERRVQIDEQVELAERLAGERRVGIRAVQVAAEAEAELQLAARRPPPCRPSCRGPASSAA